MLNVKKKEKVKIEEMREKTKLKDIGVVVKGLKWNYAGYIS